MAHRLRRNGLPPRPKVTGALLATEASLILFGLISVSGAFAPVRHGAPGTRHSGFSLSYESTATGAQLQTDGHAFHVRSAVLAAIFLLLATAVASVLPSHLRRSWREQSNLIRATAAIALLPAIVAAGLIWVFGTLG